MAYDDALASRLRALAGTEPNLTEKRMFGGLAFLIGGNMAVAVSGQGGLLLRVPPERTAALNDRPHAEPFVMRGRAMEGWLRISPEGLESDEDLRRWAEIGLAYARSLPAKTA